MRVSAFTVVTVGTTIEETVATLAELGYEGVEWRVHDEGHIRPTSLLADAERARKASQSYGLAVSGLSTYLANCQLGNAKQIEAVVEAATILGATQVRVYPSRYTGETPFGELLERTRHDLESAVQIASKRNVRLLTEIHFGYLTSSPSLAYMLVHGFDPDCVGVLFDPGNMIIEGMEQWKLGLELLGPYLSHVHLKNALWYRDERGWQRRWAGLEEGQVHWPDVLAALHAVGYDGWLSLEDLRPVPWRERLAEIAYVRQLIGRSRPG